MPKCRRSIDHNLEDLLIRTESTNLRLVCRHIISTFNTGDIRFRQVIPDETISEIGRYKTSYLLEKWVNKVVRMAKMRGKRLFHRQGNADYTKDDATT